MKIFFLLFCAQASVMICNAQWIMDPEAPQLVSDTECVQQLVQQVDDGNGGVFVFWLDARTGCNNGTNNDVYGQHFDAEGIELWDIGGREIMNCASHIPRFKVKKFDDELIIGCHLQQIGISPDSIIFQKLGNEGQEMWANDLVLGVGEQCLPPGYILGFANFDFTKASENYHVILYTSYCGGFVNLRHTSFAGDGTLTGQLNGLSQTSIYNIYMHGIQPVHDDSDESYFYYKEGLTNMCLRLGAESDTIWGPVSLIPEAETLSEWSGLSDAGGIASCYVRDPQDGTGTNIYLRKTDPDGTGLWGTDAIPVCIAEGLQANVNFKQDENYYYICWADARPGLECGSSDIYAQKISKADGTTQWTDNGIPVFSQCTYLPFPKLEVAPNGDVLFTNESTTEGLNVTRVDAAGNFLMAEPLHLSTALPFYNDYDTGRTGSGTVVSWSKSYGGGGADGIYIAHIPDSVVVPDNIFSVDDNVGLALYPNPGNNELNVSSQQHMSGSTLMITDIHGRIIYREQLKESRSTVINTAGFNEGIYMVCVINGQQHSIASWIKY